MFFHVTLTTECNLQCRYCFGETLDDFDEDFEGFEVDYSLPKKPNYSWEILANFCAKDPECVVTFYGGEPLLNIDDMVQVMNRVKTKLFMIQTNGLLLDQLPSEYANRLHTILVSIDGDEALTDHYRGKGTYRKVMDNLKLLKKNGFGGELIARMTVMEQTDIEKQVKHLLENNDFPFTSVHWQLNAGFWGNDFLRRNFKEWSETNYTLGVAKLAQFWVDQIAKEGKVLKLYPLLGIAKSLLHNEPSLLRCGGGWINYSIQTDGFIIPCPTMWGMKKYYLGHISTANPLEIGKIPTDQEPCVSCDINELCGGRCLYTNLTRRWSKEAYASVCKTVSGLVDSVKEQLPRISQLISSGKIGLNDFDYLEYNGCEIIP
jgi:uncharacterized protein